MGCIDNLLIDKTVLEDASKFNPGEHQEEEKLERYWERQSNNFLDKEIYMPPRKNSKGNNSYD